MFPFVCDGSGHQPEGFAFCGRDIRLTHRHHEKVFRTSQGVFQWREICGLGPLLWRD